MSSLDTNHALYNNILVAEYFTEDNGAGLLDNLANAYGTGSAIVETITNASISGDLISYGTPQGLAWDGTNYFVIYSDNIRKLDASFGLVTSNTSPFTSLIAGTNHLGDCCVDSTYLYIGANNYTNETTNSDAQIAVYSKADLSYVTSYDVSANMGANVSLAGLAIDTANSILYAITYDVTANGGSNTVWLFNASTGAFIETLTLNVRVPGMQGISYKSGRLYISQGVYGEQESPIVLAFGATTGVCENGWQLNFDGYLQGIDFTQSDLKVLEYDTNALIRTFTTPSLPTPSISSGALTLGPSDNQFLYAPIKLPDSCNFVMRVKANTLYNYVSYWDVPSTFTTGTNDWEGWIYADGRIALRLNSAGTAAVTAASTISAGTYYDIVGRIVKSGSTGDVELIIDDVSAAASSGQTWIAPPSRGHYLGGGNVGNSDGDNTWEYYLLFNADLTSAQRTSLINDPTQLLVSGDILIVADPITANGSLSGQSQISVFQQAVSLSGLGSLQGVPVISVNQLAETISATGSLSGVAYASEVVLINADPIQASGSIDGSPTVLVKKVAAPLNAAGSLSGQVALSVNRLAAAIMAGGSLTGTEVTSNGVVITADPIASIGSINGQVVIAVDIAAQLISASGQLLGTVQVTTPGNVLISSTPIQATSNVQADSPVIDVNMSGVISASGLVDGAGFTGLVIQATPIAGAGNIAGGYEISVDIPSNVISAIGSLSGDLVRNVLQAAAAIVARGDLVGTAQIIGPGQLGTITRPGIISNTPRYAVISITPRRGVLH